MRPALGQWDQGSERHRLNRERVQFCGYDDALYNHRLCGGLRDPRQVDAFGRDPDMLGRPVCKHELDVCKPLGPRYDPIYDRFISYGATLVLYAANFPRLARNTRHTRDLREKYDCGEISAEVYEREESLEKNRISNISTTHSNIGYGVTYVLNLSLLLSLKDNPRVNNYVLVLTNGYWVLLGIWWFIYQQPRPGPNLPKGESYLTIGWKQIGVALKQYKKIPHTFIYLFAYFLLADGLNTTGILVVICQNNKFKFSFLQNTYLGLAQAITSTASTLGSYYIQRYWKISTKKMVWSLPLFLSWERININGFSSS